LFLCLSKIPPESKNQQSKRVTPRFSEKAALFSSPDFLQMGTPAMTSRGFKEEDVVKTAEAIALVIDNQGAEAAMEQARAIVKELCDKHPLHTL